MAHGVYHFCRGKSSLQDLFLIAMRFDSSISVQYSSTLVSGLSYVRRVFRLHVCCLNTLYQLTQQFCDSFSCRHSICALLQPVRLSVYYSY